VGSFKPSRTNPPYLAVDDNSDSTSARNVVSVITNHVDAVAARPLYVRNDAVAAEGTVVVESTAAETNPLLELRNSNAATDKPPILRFNRADTTAEADDMALGSIEFYGHNAANAAIKYASISAYSSDVTVDDEAGEVVFSAMIGGRTGNSSLTECMVFGMEDTAAGQRAFALQINRQNAADVDFIVRGQDVNNLIRTRCETNQVGFGSGPDQDINALVQVVTVLSSSIPAPRMTTTQRDALTKQAGGCMIYNTSTNKLNFYNGSAWRAIDDSAV